MTLSVVVCTRNRAGDLADCLRSLAAQTRLPRQVVVVDASDDDASRESVAAWAAERRIAAVDYVQTRPGLARQRNLGVAIARGDVVTFLDDDVVLAPGYLAAVADVFDSDPRLGGVEGAVESAPLAGRRRLANLLRRVFLLPSLGPRRGVKRSGWATYDPWPATVRFTSCLVGCNMSYRREILERYGFDEWFDGYGLLEDQDFSFRVARTHPLAQTPRARLVHRVSPVARDRVAALHEMSTVNHYYFVRKNLPPRPLTWAAFCWSELGDFLSVAKTADVPSIRAKLRGYRRILRTLGPRRAALPVGEALS